MQTLRDYQVDLVDRIKNRLDEGERVMAQLPTGGGKSACFGALAKEYNRVLLLVHRIELVHQAKKHLELWCDREVGIIAAGIKPNPFATIQVASIQTIARRNYKSRYNLCIVDEAHHVTAESYNSVLARLNADCHVVGFTATPWRLDGSGFEETFDVLETGNTVRQLIDTGYLAKYVFFANPTQKSEDGKEEKKLFELDKVGEFGGEYSLADLARDNNPRDVAAQMFNAWNRYSQDKQTVVFALNIEHSMTIAAYFEWAGVPAGHLDADSPTEERMRVMADFISGRIKVLSNVGLFDEGVDIPALECVILGRPTKSLTRYLQCCGRVLRPHPDKEHGIIVDMTQNWIEHGLPDFEREWSLNGNPPSPKEKVERNKNDEVVEIFPEFFALPEKQTHLDKIDTSSEWGGKLSVLFTTQKARGYKPGWIVFRLKDMNPPLLVWQLAATHLGYKPGWSWHKWKETQAEHGVMAE